MTTSAARELYGAWVYDRFAVLVPKKRGSGFLKVPLGHHADAALARLADQARCDIYGLDGALDFQCPGSVYHGGEATRAAFADPLIPALEAHYGCPFRWVSPATFWAHHPIGLPD